jgi:coenzyme F420 hydrogenase subunit beta
MAAAQGRWYKDLEQEVIKERCVLCGTCIASCPTAGMTIHEELPTAPYLGGECIGCGLCWAFCPRGGLDIEGQEARFAGKSNSPMGNYLQAYSAKSKDKDVAKTGQDGGVVSSILISLFKAGKIDAAIVTGTVGKPWKGGPMIITSEEDVLRHSGSVYSQSYINSLIREAADQGYKSIAVVGLPCEIEGLRAIKQQSLKLPDHGAVKYLIGLFCTENFDYRRLFREKLPSLGVKPRDIKKIDIQKGEFIVHGEGGELIRIKVKELKEAMLVGCNFCPDFAANTADISVGSVGSERGFSTVLIRSEYGSATWNMAKDTLEAEDTHDIEAVQRLAAWKRKRAAKNKEAAN